VCAEGSFVNDDNECEKWRGKEPVAKRDTDDRRVRERPTREGQSLPEIGMPKPRVSGGAAASDQIVCDGTGCRPVRRGCHIDYRGAAPDASQTSQQHVKTSAT
jgi:hypothetical protein